MSDLLDMEYINSLPQPLFDDGWPIDVIDVETGLYRIDVCGKRITRHVGSLYKVTDSNGNEHKVDDFYTDPECWVTRTAAAIRSGK